MLVSQNKGTIYSFVTCHVSRSIYLPKTPPRVWKSLGQDDLLPVLGHQESRTPSGDAHTLRQNGFHNQSALFKTTTTTTTSHSAVNQFVGS